MADTKITRLRNLLTPIKNYIAMVNADKMGKTISAILLDKELENINKNSKEIWAIIAEIPDDACEGKTSDENGALPIPDVSGSLPFDEAALKREYNLETYGKMTDYDRKQLWKWFAGKLKGNDR
jgi:hypothetical protein